MSSNEFEQAFRRICDVIGVRTQTGVAEHLGIRQSSVSDAKRRCAIPDSWLVILVERHGISPAWIRSGQGPQRLADCSVAAESARHMTFDELLAEIRSRFSLAATTL